MKVLDLHSSRYLGITGSFSVRQLTDLVKLL